MLLVCSKPCSLVPSHVAHWALADFILCFPLTSCTPGSALHVPASGPLYLLFPSICTFPPNIHMPALSILWGLLQCPLCGGDIPHHSLSRSSELFSFSTQYHVINLLAYLFKVTMGARICFAYCGIPTAWTERPRGGARKKFWWVNKRLAAVWRKWIGCSDEQALLRCVGKVMSQGDWGQMGWLRTSKWHL